MAAQDFFVEIGTEELPPKALKTLATAFADNLQAELAKLELSHADVVWYAAPRRLAVRINALAAQQADKVVEKRGPAIASAFDADGKPTKAAQGWAAEVIESGLAACAQMIAGIAGPYCFGDQVTLADILLVPQLGNARRFGAAHDFPRLLQIEENCRRLPAFIAADPAQQPGAQ